MHNTPMDVTAKEASRQHFSPEALRGEVSTHLEKNQKAVALQTLQVVAARANQPGAVRATRCFCRPVQERRNNEVDCSGQRGPRAERGAASVQADQPAQGHWGGESDGPRPQSQAARDVGALAFGQGSSSQRKQKPTKK